MQSRKNIPGLPPEVLFQHLDKIPAGRVSEDFLKQKVWWWHHRERILDLWIRDQLEAWPQGIVFGKISVLERQIWGRAEAEKWLRQATQTKQEELALDQWWDQEQMGARAYEWESRLAGKYLRGGPYDTLQSKQRKLWRDRHWRQNLDSVPAVAFDVPSNAELFELPKEPKAKGEMLEAFRWTAPIRLNLVHGDGFLHRAIEKLLAEERRRLEVPNAKHQAAGRRGLKISWAEVENIDWRGHCKHVTTQAGRQREYEAKKRKR